MAALLEPFSCGYMVNAMWVSALVGGVCAFLSCDLMLKGWPLIGDALSHAVFPGVVIAYIVSLPYAVGAFAAGMASALATGFLKDNSRIKQGMVMGVVFSGMFGLGLHVKIQSEVHLGHILFGDMLGVSGQDIALTGAIAALTAGIIGLRWRDLLLHAFDPARRGPAGCRSA
jgi:manganese/iron transport system permease protein